MDTIKIGSFLATLRKERGLTQEALGEQLGVTNKTISRWENGNYLPPVEMLQLLSNFYSVSINELLCGERIAKEQYKEKAEETITGILAESPFSWKERSDYWKKKWQKDHRLLLILSILLLFTLLFIGWYFHQIFVISVTPFLGVLLYMKLRNDMMIYVENHLYGPLEKK